MKTLALIGMLTCVSAIALAMGALILIEGLIRFPLHAFDEITKRL